MRSPGPVRVAIVGVGSVADGGHLRALRAQGDRVEVVAAVDTDPERVRSFCSRHQIPSGFTDLSEMLETLRPDLVHICTPPALHAAQTVQCLDAGSWVWVEKPFCLSLEQFDAIDRAERRTGGYASVVLQHRFGSAGIHAARLLAAGELGRPLVAHCSTNWFRDRPYFEAPWRGSWESEGGGTTLSHGIHQMDLLLALVGEWTEVSAMIGRLDRDVQTDDVSVATIRFDNGALGTIVNSVLSPREESAIRLDTTEATIELRHLYGYENADWTYTPAPHIDPDSDRVRLWRRPDENIRSSHAAQLSALLDARDAGTRPPMSGPPARQALELITGLYKSALTGATVRRDELSPTDPFYRHLHGDLPPTSR